jgi:ribonuclease HII
MSAAAPGDVPLTKTQAAKIAAAARRTAKRKVHKKVDLVMSNGGRPDLRVEKELLRGGIVRLAAMDEVGRGALAGPVTVGVVVVTISVGRVPSGLKDSKLLSPPAREALVPSIRRWIPEHGVGHAWPEEIDRIGIIAALRLAGRRALDLLEAPVDAVLLDGNHDYLSEPDPGLFDLAGVEASDAPAEDLAVDPARLLRAIPEERKFELPGVVKTRIKADLTCAGVAGASVLAKTERDGLLVALATEHPEYQFEVNKGYGTAEHVAALRRFGPSLVHRRSWNLPVN